MKRLANLRVLTKDNGRALAKVSSGKTKTVKLNVEARAMLKLEADDNIDVLEGDAEGEFFIAKAGHGKYGSKMNADGVFMSASIASMLKKFGHAFEITNATTEFDGLTWNKLSVVNDISEKEVNAEMSEVEQDGPAVSKF